MQSVVQLRDRIAPLVQFVVRNSLCTLRWLLVRDGLQQPCYISTCASGQVSDVGLLSALVLYLGGLCFASAPADVWVVPVVAALPLLVFA